MNLTKAIAAALSELADPATCGEIADKVWQTFESSRASRGRSEVAYSSADEFRAAVEDAVMRSRKFAKIRSRDDGVLVSLAATVAPWSSEELAASVSAYIEMRDLALKGTNFVKKAYYADLAKKFQRAPSAYEFRMQNISAVLSAQGRYWIPGLPPAKHVGANVFAKIVEILAALEGRMYDAIAPPSGVVSARRAPQGKLRPRASVVEVTRFDRDARVRDWVLQNAAGKCEACDAPAPFVGAEGPFLEVHHLRRLADGGSDTTTNAVALCPNCHRRLHYAFDAPKIIRAMYMKVARLRSEFPLVISDLHLLVP